MQVRADSLYKALKDIGPLPKTYQVEEITVCTDTVTGNTHKDKRVHKYALVRVTVAGCSVVVEFDRLKAFAHVMRDMVLTMNVKDSLDISYPHGNFALLSLRGTPGAELKLDGILGTL
ncbi:hypothetical protein [Alicyclobacillus fastidiosus]|uniref:Uncharacterized protein n=1 Tax=Alicyclobacillus fastidiosus TaxID=392011 RepID=A0ABV5AL25_9BACL